MLWNERNSTTKTNQRPCSLEGHGRRRLEQTWHLVEDDTFKDGCPRALADLHPWDIYPCNVGDMWVRHKEDG